MKPTLTMAHILPAVPLDTKVIAIAGIRGSGKTTLANEWGWRVVHCDDYLSQFAEPHRATGLIQKCNAIRGNYIVEGCLVGRMLRTGDRDGTWRPDFIIWRQTERILHGWDKGLQTIFHNYLKHRTQHVPVMMAP